VELQLVAFKRRLYIVQFPKNGPTKTNYEAIRMETYENQTSRKTKTTMARRCHGRSKKAESQNLK
jgi:hypothetical protein